ncbi:hypothetical protein BJF78_28405 [Pseudonocardia sp. CNS-139]|nr:hypothetical protein BJF78_28405 [Pseudonocardia sp. CNS-139]
MTLSRVMALRGHLHDHGLDRHLHHPVGDRDDRVQAGRADLGQQPPEAQDHAALVLLDHPQAGGRQQHGEQDNDDDHGGEHGPPPSSERATPHPRW